MMTSTVLAPDVVAALLLRPPALRQYHELMRHPCWNYVIARAAEDRYQQICDAIPDQEQDCAFLSRLVAAVNRTSRSFQCDPIAGFVLLYSLCMKVEGLVALRRNDEVCRN